MICKYCGRETDSIDGICPACKYRQSHPQDDISVDIYSSSGAAKAEETFHIESNFKEDFPDEVIYLNTQGEMPKKRKLSKKGIAIISAACALLLCGVIALFGGFSSSANKIVKSLEVGDYNGAYNIFVKNYTTAGSPTLCKALRERMSDAVDAYANGDTAYTAVSTELETIKKMGIGELAKDIDSSLKMVKKLKASKESFEKAEKYFTKAQYNLAITAYKKVIKEDINYTTASEKLNTAIGNYRNSALSEASVFAGDGDYAKGVEVLESALAILEKDTLIEKRIKEYKKSELSKGKAEVISVADKYAFKGDYEAAIETINQAFETNPDLKDDKTLKANRAYYIDKYIAEVSGYFEGLVEEEKYTDAAALLKKAEALVGEQKEFNKLREGLEGELPTYLDNLSPTDTNEWNFTTEATLDSFGNDRAKEENCIKLGSGAYAVYNISDGYEFFTTYVVAAKDIDEAVKCRIKVTATVGGETRFRECELSADKEPQELKFNISECETLEIEVSGEGASVIMYNANIK